MIRTIPFSDLAEADLIVDAVYEGGSAGNSGDDAISKLLPGAGNQGGFRAAGSGDRKAFVVLYTSGEDGDWPDRLDPITGQFAYYGDNKQPGHALHETRRGGNALLRTAFESLHSGVGTRRSVPPFFIFTKHPTSQSSRSVQFRGLAAPGFPGVAMTDDLVAIWKITDGGRFQNYRALFTVLNVAVVPRIWLGELPKKLPAEQEHTPAAWLRWVDTGAYSPLSAEPTKIIRSVDEQIPDTALKAAILRTVWEQFEAVPTAFETFAARVYQMSDPRVIVDEVTRATMDGGRDAIGRYLLGLSTDPVYAEFALEAKCYRPPLDGATPTTVGVHDVSRLISRIRHRQFGVLVTTSVVARQAYEEVRGDRHPIVFLSGRDIAEILIHAGYNTPDRVRDLMAASP